MVAHDLCMACERLLNTQETIPHQSRFIQAQTTRDNSAATKVYGLIDTSLNDRCRKGTQAQTQLYTHADTQARILRRLLL